MIWIALTVAAVEYVAVLVGICCLLSWSSDTDPRSCTPWDVMIAGLWPVMVPAMVVRIGWAWWRTRRSQPELSR